MKKKLSLNEINISSFVTNLNNAHLMGGIENALPDPTAVDGTCAFSRNLLQCANGTAAGCLNI